MALIENSNSKEDIKNSGYYRLTGEERIALLMQQYHAASITNGTELEHYIKKWTQYEVVEAQYRTTRKDGKPLKNPHKIPGTSPTYVDVIDALGKKGVNRYFPKISITKEELKSRGIEYTRGNAIEVDGLWVTNGKIIITEYKDGSAFDTKKSDGEISSLKKLELFFNEYDVNVYMVLWNLDDVKNASIKSKEAPSYLITGRAFCDLVLTDFEAVNADRMADQRPNRDYFVETAIPIVLDHGKDLVIAALESDGYQITKKEN